MSERQYKKNKINFKKTHQLPPDDEGPCNDAGYLLNCSVNWLVRSSLYYLNYFHNASNVSTLDQVGLGRTSCLKQPPLTMVCLKDNMNLILL